MCWLKKQPNLTQMQSSTLTKNICVTLYLRVGEPTSAHQGFNRDEPDSK